MVADIVAVGEVVENRYMYEWDLNMNAYGEIELGVEREGLLICRFYIYILTGLCTKTYT